MVCITDVYSSHHRTEGQSCVAYYINVGRGGLCPADLVVKARQELGAGRIIPVVETES